MKYLKYIFLVIFIFLMSINITFAKSFYPASVLTGVGFLTPGSDHSGNTAYNNIWWDNGTSSEFWVGDVTIDYDYWSDQNSLRRH